jgi:hypothetical protein
LAKEHSRSSLFEALQARSCYATTGERIILGFSIAGYGMGAELDTKSRPGLEWNRYITGYVIGTTSLTEVALIRNGKILHPFDVKGERIDFAWDDTQPLSQIAREPRGEGNPFVYYYLRVIQKDGHIAWSSPIWISLNSKTIPSFEIKAVKKKKSG